MKKYYVTYRAEFEIVVKANSKAEAIEKVLVGKTSGCWKEVNELHPDMLEVFLDESEVNCGTCKNN